MRVKTVEQRNEFIDAAGHLFIQQGYAAVTMEAIAAEAGKSKVTLYNYFSSKEELFEAFVIQAGAGAVEELTKVYVEEDSARDILQRLGLQ
ncbi:TetR/AcrR family transcriptional regulator [Herbaspirillum huttiense]|uniref:TetR/AcrR family transcriptional regulator n=1 Tax=Herbaspirillum huttiense TaxID=863372 RepID=UPI000420128F|nr:helix-turn-helix domain-containing protein [Herbaspirillum huttiense]